MHLIKLCCSESEQRVWGNAETIATLINHKHKLAGSASLQQSHKKSRLPFPQDDVQQLSVTCICNNYWRGQKETSLAVIMTPVLGRLETSCHSKSSKKSFYSPLETDGGSEICMRKCLFVHRLSRSDKILSPGCPDVTCVMNPDSSPDEFSRKQQRSQTPAFGYFT